MMRTSKKVNLLFLAVVLLHLTASMVLSMLLLRSFTVNLVAQLIISELAILIPGFIFLLLNNCNLPEWLPFRKPKASTVLWTILFTYLIMPLITMVNIFSQLFTKNAITEMSTELLSLPFVVVVLIVGVFGPFCEEFIFRGIIYSGYRKTGRIFLSAFLSALLFGLMHMNFNQFCYAFVLGFIFAMLIEATGNLWPAVIGHVIVNTHNVVMLYGAKKLYSVPGMDMEALIAEEITLDMKLYMLGVYLILSVIFTALACMVFWALCKTENREAYIRSIFKREKDKAGKDKRLLSVAGVLGILVCLFVMFGLQPLLAQLGR